MCGKICHYVSTKKNAPEGAESMILKSTGSVCTLCTDHVWQVVDSKLEVKWCQKCRKWYPWAEFQGMKGMVKKCSTCRSVAPKRKQDVARLLHTTGEPNDVTEAHLMDVERPGWEEEWARWLDGRDGCIH
jgi:hypothetical protein